MTRTPAPGQHVRNIGALLTTLVVGVAACGDKRPPEKGACTMRNALVEPRNGVPPGLEICLGMQVDADCDGQSANLRKLTGGITTTAHVFHPGKACEQVGYPPCDGTPLPFGYHRPCTIDGASGGTPGGLALPDPGAAGPAYIALQGGVAVILPDGTAQTVSNLDRDPWIRNMAPGDDGRVYVTTARDRHVRFFRLDGATATALGAAKGFTLSTALAVAKDGQIYFAQNDEVMRFDGKTAKRLPATGMSIVNQLAFDAGGALVAAYTGELRRFVNDAWQAVELPHAESHTGVWILGSGDDLVVGVQDVGFFKLVGGKLEPTMGEAKPGRNRPARTSTGVIAYRTVESGKTVTRLHDPKGGTASSERAAVHIAATVVDARGRLWYVHDGGLTVASLTTKEITRYPIGTLPAVADVGYASGEGQLVVVGAGPDTLPPVGAVRVVGKVTGTISVGKAALASADIELCTFASSSYRSTPCDDAPTSRRPGKTDGNGNFVLEGVPVGNYHLAFRYGGRWGLAGSTYIDLTEPVAERELGKLRYDAPR